MATSVLLSRLFRSSVRVLQLADLGLELVVDRVQLLVEDCSSSFEVSSSSLEACSSSLIEVISSFEAFSSSLQVSICSMVSRSSSRALSSSACSCRSLAGLPARLMPPPRPRLRARRSSPSAGSASSPPGLERRHDEPHGVQGVPAPDAGVGRGLPVRPRAPCVPARRGLPPVAPSRAGVGRLAARRPQIVFGRAAEVVHAVLRVDQHACRRVALEQRLIHQLARAHARAGLGRLRPRCPGAAELARLAIGKSTDVVAGRPEPAGRSATSWRRLEQVLLAGDRSRRARGTVRRPRAARSGTAPAPASAPRARGRSAGCGS